MSAEIPDADLVGLARGGDPVAFRLLVERHQPMVRARARSLCGNASDVDDVMQESFLQAFIALDRLRDPERFAGWLAAIVLHVCRAQYRRARPALLPDWPESLHPASADGSPSAEDLDRSEALRAAIACLPDGQRRAVALHYYAGLPAGQIAGQPGTARVSLHKARGRLRAYITEHRPDLIPAARRTHMTTVRVTRLESRIPPGPVPDALPHPRHRAGRHRRPPGASGLATRRRQPPVRGPLRPAGPGHRARGDRATGHQAAGHRQRAHRPAAAHGWRASDQRGHR